MNIIVTGGSGQLGGAIQRMVSSIELPHTFTFPSRQELDLSSSISLKEFFQNNRFDLIINCGAYTKVDEAEFDRESALRVNCYAVEELAEIAKKNNSKFIHISTDYVFEGNNINPIQENYPTNPINYYGESKLEGEKILQKIMPFNALILRTSWVYSETGKNFLKTIIRKSHEVETLKVVDDQFGSPTYSADLAEVVIKIVGDDQFINNQEKTEIYHYSSEGRINWFDFAMEILKHTQSNCIIESIKTKDFPTPASRPKNTYLDKAKVIQRFGLKIKPWKDSLKVCIDKIYG